MFEGVQTSNSQPLTKIKPKETVMEVQEMSFWELALECIESESAINRLQEGMDELLLKAEPYRQALNAQIEQGLETGEIQPGRYSWGNDFVYIHQTGTMSVSPHPQSLSPCELPGYSEWSAEIERKRVARAERGEG